MNVLEALVKGRKLISDEERWTTGASARDVNGNNVPSVDPTATCWCTIGAIGKIVFSDGDVNTCQETIFSGAIRSLEAHVPYQKFGGRMIAPFNDTHTHAEVLAVWDKAIAAERTRHE